MLVNRGLKGLGPQLFTPSFHTVELRVKQLQSFQPSMLLGLETGDCFFFYCSGPGLNWQWRTAPYLA